MVEMVLRGNFQHFEFEQWFHNENCAIIFFTVLFFCVSSLTYKNNEFLASSQIFSSNSFSSRWSTSSISMLWWATFASSIPNIGVPWSLSHRSLQFNCTCNRWRWILHGHRAGKCPLHLLLLQCIYSPNATAQRQQQLTELDSNRQDREEREKMHSRSCPVKEFKTSSR